MGDSFTYSKIIKDSAEITVNRVYYYDGRSFSLDIIYNDIIVIKNSDEIFYNCSDIKLINLTLFITSEIEFMSDMLAYCYGLEYKQFLPNFGPKIIDIKNMFYNCEFMRFLYLSNFNTS